MTHGFLNNFDTTWLHNMKDAIQQTENGTAVIVSTPSNPTIWGHS